MIHFAKLRQLVNIRHCHMTLFSKSSLESQFSESKAKLNVKSIKGNEENSDLFLLNFQL